ncbi:Uncharacterised protein [Burkholderia pseudomallei]|nr:Uncharacterised protein [Burkholderia pseudomallei]
MLNSRCDSPACSALYVTSCQTWNAGAAAGGKPAPARGGHSANSDSTRSGAASSTRKPITFRTTMASVMAATGERVRRRRSL